MTEEEEPPTVGIMYTYCDLELKAVVTVYEAGYSQGYQSQTRRENEWEE